MNDSANIVAATRKELFSVECTTCKARLKVRSMAAIGQILSCPKCHSMVLVAPPADWQPEGTAPPVATNLGEADGAATVGGAGFAWKLWAAAGAATVVCGLAVFAIWRVFPTPPAVAAVTEAPPAVETDVSPEAPEVAAPEPSATPEMPEAPPAAVEGESPAPADKTPSEQPAAAPAPMEAPAAAPPPVTVVAKPPVEQATPPVVPAQEPPPAVEVSTADDLVRKLRTSVAGIDEPSIRLDALAELLGGIAACPITLDVESLEAANLSGETLATVKVEDATVEAALLAALEPLGLDFEARGRAIVIFAAEK